MRILAGIGGLAILAAVAVAIFFLGGFYSVAGSEPDLALVHWALARVRTVSINRHGGDQPPAGLDDPARIQEGARAFATIGCVNCHGAPGVKWAKFSEGLHPDPPDLKELASDRTVAQLFWVIKNGINMTGMACRASCLSEPRTRSFGRSRRSSSSCRASQRPITGAGPRRRPRANRIEIAAER